MPVVDLFIRAVNDASPTYSQRRLRYRAGEVVDYRVDTGQGVLEGYGVVPLLSRRWRIVRVADALATDGDLLKSSGSVTAEQVGIGIQGQRRVWMIRLNDIPNAIKNNLVPRKYPDIDHQFFLNHPNVRDRMIARFPGLLNVPQGQRRSTPWDISVTRAQIAPYFFLKPSELEDLSGFPVDPGSIPDQQIDEGDDL